MKKKCSSGGIQHPGRLAPYRAERTHRRHPPLSFAGKGATNRHIRNSRFFVRSIPKEEQGHRQDLQYRAAYRRMSKTRHSGLFLTEKSMDDQTTWNYTWTLSGQIASSKRAYLMTAGRNLLQKFEQEVMRVSNGCEKMTNFLARGLLSTSACASVWKKHNSSSTARLALEPEIHLERSKYM